MWRNVRSPVLPLILLAACSEADSSSDEAAAAAGTASGTADGTQLEGAMSAAPGAVGGNTLGNPAGATGASTGMLPSAGAVPGATGPTGSTAGVAPGASAASGPGTTLPSGSAGSSAEQMGGRDVSVVAPVGGDTGAMPPANGAGDMMGMGEGAGGSSQGAGPDEPPGGSELPSSECTPNGRARNPLITQVFTADPNAVVYDDRVYVYTSHDEDGQDNFDMVDYRAFSSDDMVNWQDHGVQIHARDLPWAANLYAPGACRKNGKYYLYVPNSGSNIGVAVSDDPGGPFVDPLGVALVTKSFPNANVDWLFDPACFIDDDGQAYLYFGGGPSGQNARAVRLNDDMISIMDSEATTIPTTAFFEASFMHKRDGKYYFSYSSDFSSGHGASIEYLMADSPMSGFEYQGKVLNNANINRGNNNHHSIIDFAGKTYIFYHNRKLEQELGVDKVNNRSIVVQEITYNPDGTFQTLDMSSGDYTIEQLKCLDGFAEVEAERFAEENGIEVEGLAGSTVRIAEIADGDWVAYSQVDFRDGATSLVAEVASAAGGGSIDVVVDGCIGGEAGTSIGSCEVTSTGGADTYAPITCALTETSGAHDLCLRFSGSGFELDSFHLE